MHSRLYRWKLPSSSASPILLSSSSSFPSCPSTSLLDLYGHHTHDSTGLRCKVMKRCSSRKRSNKKRSKAKKLKNEKLPKKRGRKNKKLWKVRKHFLHREKMRQGREKKTEKKESKKMLNLRRDTKPDFFHIVGNSQENGETSSTAKLFQDTEPTMHRRGF